MRFEDIFEETEVVAMDVGAVVEPKDCTREAVKAMFLWMELEGLVLIMRPLSSVNVRVKLVSEALLPD